MTTNLKIHPKNYFDRLQKTIKSIDNGKLVLLISKIELMIGTNKTIFIAGNGGSAATSSHMACDLGKTILGKNASSNNNRLKVISLNENTALITAWANDEDYKSIFSEQLKSLGKSGDTLIVITGSGNSQNIIEVLKSAKKLNIETFGILGFDGGEARKLLDNYLIIESNDYGIIEDMHMIIVHLITDWLKKQKNTRKHKTISSEKSNSHLETISQF